ncbi:MAG: hypothetical protein ACLSAF_03480 [Intestinimonas sp.]
MTWTRCRKKYDGLDGTELAISGKPGAHGRGGGRRGRGAVHRRTPTHENLEAYVVAEVTRASRMVMRWGGEGHRRPLRRLPAPQRRGQAHRRARARLLQPARACVATGILPGCAAARLKSGLQRGLVRAL